jgi:hypothetical protein
VDQRVNQPPMGPPPQMSPAEQRVNLCFGILQAIAFNADEPETVAMRAACAETITAFVKETAGYEAAWSKGKTAVTA